MKAVGIWFIVILLILISVVIAYADASDFDVIVEGENDGICGGEYWVEDLENPYRWVRNPAWIEPTCDYERVQEALDNYPGGRILLSGTFDFNNRNVAIMHDNTELIGDGTAVIRNGANTITVGHIRQDIQYHFADPAQFTQYKIVNNFTISNIRFEDSLQMAISVIGHDGESYITDNDFIGGRFTEENVAYHIHNVNTFIGVWNLLPQDTALRGVINIDNNYMDGQLRIDPDGHRFWYCDRPDLKYNGMVWGIANFVNGVAVNANHNVIKNVGNGIYIWAFPTNISGLVTFTSNNISIVNGPYIDSTGIEILTWEKSGFEYLIADNLITLDYQPELDFATYPEWGIDPEAEYLRAEFYEGIVLWSFKDIQAYITNNIIRFAESHPDRFLDHSGMAFFREESNLAIDHNKFEGSALYAINFFGGNNNNILHANNFVHFSPFPESVFHPWEFYLESADIIFGMAYPANNNVVLGGGSSSVRLEIIDNGIGNLVGNNTVAHTDPLQMKLYHDAIKEQKDRKW
jgi:hypothetical protein